MHAVSIGVAASRSIEYFSPSPNTRKLPGSTTNSRPPTTQLTAPRTTVLMDNGPAKLVTWCRRPCACRTRLSTPNCEPCGNKYGRARGRIFARVYHRRTESWTNVRAGSNSRMGRNHKKHIRHKEVISLVPFALLVVPSPPFCWGSLSLTYPGHARRKLPEHLLNGLGGVFHPALGFVR